MHGPALERPRHSYIMHVLRILRSFLVKLKAWHQGSILIGPGPDADVSLPGLAPPVLHIEGSWWATWAGHLAELAGELENMY